MRVARLSPAPSMLVFMASGALCACALDANGTGPLFGDAGGPSSATSPGDLGSVGSGGSPSGGGGSSGSGAGPDAGLNRDDGAATSADGTASEGGAVRRSAAAAATRMGAAASARTTRRAAFKVRHASTAPEPTGPARAGRARFPRGPRAEDRPGLPAEVLRAQARAPAGGMVAPMEIRVPQGELGLRRAKWWSRWRLGLVRGTLVRGQSTRRLAFVASAEAPRPMAAGMRSLDVVVERRPRLCRRSRRRRARCLRGGRRRCRVPAGNLPSHRESIGRLRTPGSRPWEARTPRGHDCPRAAASTSGRRGRRSRRRR